MLLILLSLCIAQENPIQPYPPESKDQPDFLTIQYKETESDPNLTSLDIYTPDSPGLHPVMIYVHGGGWQRGDKKNVGHKSDFFTEEGFMFVSVNYRLSPEVMYPLHVQDVADAAAWVAQNAGQYRGDPDRIFIMGHSAGAHLVSLLGADEKYMENSGYSLEILKGVISLDTGLLDIPLQVETQKSSLRLVKSAISNNAETWKEASPVHHVEAGKGIPPYLLVYVSSRERSAGVQAKNMKQKFEEEGVTCEVYRAENKTHQTLNQEIGTTGDEPTAKIMEFIESILNEGETDLHTDYNIHFDYDPSVEMKFCIDTIGDLKGFDMQVGLRNFFASSCSEQLDCCDFQELYFCKG